MEEVFDWSRIADNLISGITWWIIFLFLYIASRYTFKIGFIVTKRWNVFVYLGNDFWNYFVWDLLGVSFFIFVVSIFTFDWKNYPFTLSRYLRKVILLKYFFHSDSPKVILSRRFGKIFLSVKDFFFHDVF